MSCASLALPAPLLMLCCPQHRLSARQKRCIVFWVHIMIPPKCSSLWEQKRCTLFRVHIMKSPKRSSLWGRGSLSGWGVLVTALCKPPGGHTCPGPSMRRCLDIRSDIPLRTTLHAAAAGTHGLAEEA